MKKPKPIFIVGLPQSADVEQITRVSEELNKYLGEDYYTLTFRNCEDRIAYDMYWCDELDEKTFEELKEIVHSEMKTK